MKTLLLMRHAKSDWDAAYGADHDRPLNERGVRSARLVGRLLKGIGLVPGHVMTSSATRARTTAELASEAGEWGCPIDLEPAFYGTGPERVLEAASSAPDVERLMLVGHQPTWGMLVHRLTGAAVDMTTATVAEIVLIVDGWQELVAAGGVLESLHQPRQYYGTQWDLG